VELDRDREQRKNSHMVWNKKIGKELGKKHLKIHVEKKTSVTSSHYVYSYHKS